MGLCRYKTELILALNGCLRGANRCLPERGVSSEVQFPATFGKQVTRRIFFASKRRSLGIARQPQCFRGVASHFIHRNIRRSRRTIISYVSCPNVKLNPKNKIHDDWQKRVASHFALTALDELAGDDSIIDGIVVANAPDGIYLDVGCGIPAFLEIVNVDDRDESIAPHWTKSHGAKLIEMVSM